MSIQSPTGSPRGSLDIITNESEVNSLVKGFIEKLSMQEKRVLNKIEHGVHESEMRAKVKATRAKLAKLGERIGKVAGGTAGAVGATAIGVSTSGATAIVGATAGAFGAAASVTMANGSLEGKDPVTEGVKGAAYGGSLGLIPVGKYLGGEAGSAVGASVASARCAGKHFASNAGFRINSCSLQVLKEFARQRAGIECVRAYIQEHGQQYLKDDKLCVLT